MNRMSIPIYDPPYDSPLEDLFAYNMVKYLDQSVSFEKQMEVDTICGKFRLDFAAISLTSRIGFECDGAEYHGTIRDIWRDAMIVGSNTVDVVYRLRGKDLFYHMEDCLFIVSQLHPELYSERGRINIYTLSSEAAKYNLEYRHDSAMIQYNFEEPIDLIAVYWTKQEKSSKVHLHWKRLYEFVLENGGGNLDELIEKFRSDIGTEHTRDALYENAP